LRNDSKDVPGQLVHIDVLVPLEDKAWFEFQARSKGLTLSDYVRTVYADHRKAVESAPAPAEPKRLPLRERYLERVRQTGSPVSAGRELAVPAAKVTEWHRDPNFLKEVALAKAEWLESLEQDMVQIGRGRMRGDTQAIGWILNAHHPNHGRAKKELLLSMLNPLIKRLAEFLVLEFGTDARDKLKKALEQFQLEVRKKLVGFG